MVVLNLCHLVLGEQIWSWFRSQFFLNLFACGWLRDQSQPWLVSLKTPLSVKTHNYDATTIFAFPSFLASLFKFLQARKTDLFQVCPLLHICISLRLYLKAAGCGNCNLSIYSYSYSILQESMPFQPQSFCFCPHCRTLNSFFFIMSVLYSPNFCTVRQS